MAKTERSGHTTTDHDFIRRWVEERGGWPARVGGTGGGDDPGILRIDFPGFSGGDSLERMEWEEWFEKFDENQLAFLHRDMSHGGNDLDRFNKLVSRDSGDGGGSGSRSTRSSSGSKTTSSRSSSGSKSGGSKSSGSKSSGSKSGGSKSSGSKTTSSRSSSGSKSSGSKSSGASGSKSSGSKSGGSKSSGSKSGGSKSAGGSRSTASSKSSGTTARSTASKSAGKSSRGTASKSASKAGGGLLRSAVAALRGGNGGGESGAGEMRELLKHELGDLLFAEKVFLKGTRTLAKEAQEPMVKARIEEHVRETEGQIERLNEAFRSIGERPKAEKCEAALGLQEEHDSFKSEEKPSKMLLSAFDLGSGLRVEHYEIAGYRSAIAVATALGERECVALLKENLQEEVAMAAFLEKNSLAVLRAMAKA